MKKILLNLALLLFACLITLFGCEIVYRAYVYIQKPLYKPSTYPNLGWELNPGARLVENNIEDMPVKYFVNSIGCRDETAGEWKRWDSHDIKLAFIGDSITYGEGVDYKDSYCSVVKSKFIDSSQGVKVINLGIGGTNTLQHFAILNYKTISLKPDIVILGYCLNDVERRATERLPRGTQYILRHFHFGTFLIARAATALQNNKVSRSNILNVESQNNGIPAYCASYADTITESYNTEKWDENKKLICKMSDQCKRNGIQFVVICFPFEDQLMNVRKPRHPQKLMADLCSSKGIPFLDIAETYKIYDPVKLYLKGDDLHPNILGHNIAGEAICKWLLSNPRFNRIFKKYKH